MKMSATGKIFVIAIIAVVIFGIWFFKNIDSNTAVEPEGDFALHLTQKIDMDRLKSHNLPIVIDFGSDSCIPCKEMAPVLAELNSELQGRAVIKFADVWKYKELAEGYPVRVIPTQILIGSDGKAYVPDGSEPVSLLTYGGKADNPDFTVHEGQLTKEQLFGLLKKMGLK